MAVGQVSWRKTRRTRVLRQTQHRVTSRGVTHTDGIGPYRNFSTQAWSSAWFGRLLPPSSEERPCEVMALKRRRLVRHPCDRAAQRPPPLPSASEGTPIRPQGLSVGELMRRSDGPDAAVVADAGVRHPAAGNAARVARLLRAGDSTATAWRFGVLQTLDDYRSTLRRDGASVAAGVFEDALAPNGSLKFDAALAPSRSTSLPWTVGSLRVNGRPRPDCRGR